MMRRALALALQIWGALCLLALLLAGGLLLSAGWWLQASDEPRPADAIVILGGDVRRAIHAADLYAQGLAPAIYLCRPAWDKQALCDLGVACARQEDEMQAVLAARGVPAGAVRVYGEQVLSTVEEAESLGRALAPGEKRLILVTSAWHSRRTKLTFAAILPGRDLILSISPYERFETRWWTHQRSAQNVVVEAAKFAHFYLGTPFRTRAPQ